MVRDWLDEHPEDMKGFVQHFVKINRDLAWRMLEGNPKDDTDVNLKGLDLSSLFDKSKDE